MADGLNVASDDKYQSRRADEEGGMEGQCESEPRQASPTPGPSSAAMTPTPPPTPTPPAAASASSAPESESQNLLADDLGVQVYDRDAFEAEVMTHVDQMMAQREREQKLQRNTRELKDVLKKVSEIVEKVERAEARLEAMDNNGERRRIMSVLDELEKLKDKKEQMEEKREAVVQELKEMRAWDEVKKDFGIVEEDKEKSKKDEVDVESMMKESQGEETEKEKKIRLGELTAFGKSLKSTKHGDDGANKEFTRYFKEQMAINTISDEDRSCWKGAPPKAKKRKKDDTSKGTREEDIQEKEEEDFGNGTDDSDWDSSDSDNGVRRRTTRGRKRVVDDGDRQEYLDRLEAWQEGGERTLCDTKFEELEGGLHVPSSIWDSLFNYQKVCVQWLWELHQQKVGGILGDEMGLGKTIQIIAFLASLSFSQRKLSGKRFGPVLIVCPTTVMHQWVKEFHKWWPMFRVVILHDSGSHKGSRSSLVRSIASSRGILVTSFSGLVAHNEVLLQQDFQYVILDEGHKIRNPDAQVTLAAKSFPTAHRLILSGSPLQNNLKELWSLFDFIFPGKLGTLPVFMQQFSVPITHGGYANASRVQVATAYKCATVLRDTINPYLLRRMKSDVRQHISLPEKNEQVLFCRLTEEQRSMYKSYIDSGEIKHILDGRLKVFVGLINLRKICNHPDLYDGGPKHFGQVDEESLEDDETYGFWRKSGKMIVIESLLKLWKKQGHRVLLFTQSRQMLLILERFVNCQDYSYMRMDGSTAISARQPLIDKFNSSDVFVFLLTTKVGGLGVNLTGASRVVIFDPDWNPSTDTQARERAWRIGQDKQVTIYRLMTSGTIEEKIYHRQIFKQFLVNRVLKDPKQRRFFKSNDLYELFTLNEGTSDRTETSAIFAGTGSDVKVSKSRKRRLSSTEVEPPRKEHPAALKPGKKATSRESTAAATDIKATVKKLYNEKKTAPSPMTDRERLMEKVRAISRKISEGADKKDSGKKKNKKKSGKFEGHKVSHLVRTGTYKSSQAEDEEEAERKGREESQQEQDNYVLSKLFKKSGVHSAVKHDVIVGDGMDAVEDYELIETEAERVAKDAVANLRESRRQCFRAEAGVPTWTGQHGSIAKKPRFGKVKRKTRGEEGDGEGKMFSGEASSNSGKTITSSDLLAKMRQRNRFLGAGRREDQDEDDSGLFAPDNSVASTSRADDAAEGRDNLELLADIRNFVAFQAEVDGRASTYELLERFQRRLPPQKSPLFKALLGEICTFSRNREGKGIWKLRDEFA